MLAKKESFLKYLRDEIPPNKKELINDKSKNNNNNKKENNYKIKDNNYSFESFIDHINNYDYNKKIKWDSEIHRTSLIHDINIHKIKSIELFRINYINPLLAINKEYLNPIYDKGLFEQEIIHIQDKIKINNSLYINKRDIKHSNDILENPNLFVQNLIEEREKYELNKKILKYYLIYYCENNNEKIAPSLDKIEQFTKDVNFYYDKINSVKNKIHNLKKYNIDNSMKLIIKKKKHENLLKIYAFLKYIILNCYKDIKKLKLKSMDFDYINYYNETNKIINNIELIEKNIKINFNNNGQNKKLNIIDEIKKKLIKKKEKFIYKYINEINNLFDSKKSNILQLFFLYNIDNIIKSNNYIKKDQLNSQSSLFITKMTKNFKLKSKKLILETLHIFKKKERQKSNSITILNLNNQKLSSINNIHIEENYLIICFKNILSKLKILCDNFLYYYNLICSNEANTEEYKALKKEIKSRKNDFYEILDKHLSKLVKLFYNSKDKQNEDGIISKKSFLIILNLFCLFSKLLKYKFNVDYSKYLNLALKNYIVSQIKFDSRNNLTRAISLLSNDIWDINFLDHSFFQIKNIKEKTPFYLKKFIIFLNENELEDNTLSNDINNNNIESIFNYINNTDNTISSNVKNDNINFDDVVDLYNNKKGIKLSNKQQNLTILNKPLKYNKLYVTNSTCCILTEIEEQIINLIMFDYLTYEIFSYLFNTIDLYVFVCFKIFMIDYKYLSSLLKPLNFKEIQKDIENIEYWSEVTSYQQKYSELKKFYISTEKKFCEFYGNNKKFNDEEEKQKYIEHLIPKLNEFKGNINDKENIINNAINSKKNFSIFKSNKNDILEALNKKQINNLYNINNSDNKKKDKNKDLSFFEKICSTVDDIGDGLSKAKDTAKKLLKDNQYQNSIILKEIKDKILSTHIKQIIVLISTITTLYKTLKRLEGFTSKIELDFQKKQINDKLNNYKILKDQIQYFFYMKISKNLIDFSEISHIIEDFNWSPPPEIGSSQLFEASLWVNKILKLIEIIINEIIIELQENFGEKKLTDFFIILIKFIISNIQDTFAKIKNCNDIGRSIMLKDIKFLKQGIENILKNVNYFKNIKTAELFDIIFHYINAWYYNCDELIKFIFDNNIQYKYFNSFLYSSPIIKGLTPEIKNNFINKVKQRYLIQFKRVIVSLKD